MISQYFHNTSKYDKRKGVHNIEPYQIEDDIVIKEDETKFKDYFNTSKKCNVQLYQILACFFSKLIHSNKSLEVSLMKELIEQHQEMIIEIEEFAKPYEYPEEKLAKGRKLRRFINPKQQKTRASSCFQKLNNIHSSKSSWFQLGTLQFYIVLQYSSIS